VYTAWNHPECLYSFATWLPVINKIYGGAGKGLYSAYIIEKMGVSYLALWTIPKFKRFMMKSLLFIFFGNFLSAF